jgi:hypothetical protein
MTHDAEPRPPREIYETGIFAAHPSQSAQVPPAERKP